MKSTIENLTTIASNVSGFRMDRGAVARGAAIGLGVAAGSGLFALGQDAAAQSGGTPRDGGAGGQSQTVDDEFVGVTTDGNIISGLYPVVSTGLSTEPARIAVTVFLDSLSAEQRSAVVF